MDTTEKTRLITLHQTTPQSPLDHLLTIEAMGEPDPKSGAGSTYLIKVGDGSDLAWSVVFQDGVVPNGVNGVSIEALLAVCIDRLYGFQSGPFACSENREALDGLEAALAALKQRTADRIKRGVEGKYEA